MGRPLVNKALRFRRGEKRHRGLVLYMLITWMRGADVDMACVDTIGRYLMYTYPYGIQARIEDIHQAVQERRLDGLIHYTQTFCYRQIYDLIFRESFSLPLLSLEGDRPGKLDSRTQIRLESFVEMLKMRKADFP